MAKSKDDPRELRLDKALEMIADTKVKSRADGMKDLKTIFMSGASNKGALNDKAYHKILEAVFKAVIAEKHNYLFAKSEKPKTIACDRLVLFAEVAKVVVTVGLPKFKAKTIDAIAEHVIQMLTSADGNILEPISQDYIKILQIILDRRVVVEQLKTETWHTIMDFGILHIMRYVEDFEADVPRLARSFSGLGSGSLTSSGRPSGGSEVVMKQRIEILFHIIVYLVSTPDPPLSERYQDLTAYTIRFLQLPIQSIGRVYQFAFFILNRVVLFTRTNHTAFTMATIESLIPVVSSFFHNKSLGRRDEMLNIFRDEMLILLMHCHLHLEKGVKTRDSISLLTNLETLSDVLQADYAKFSNREQLQIDDLEIVDLGVMSHVHHPFQNTLFRLRPYAPRGESVWAHLQVISVLERVLKVGRESQAEVEVQEDDEQPRKRRKISGLQERLVRPLLQGDVDSRVGHLQLLSFMLHEVQFRVEELSEMIDLLLICMREKRGDIANWALLAVSCCIKQNSAKQIISSSWNQVWQSGTRALLINTTCRTASLQLHMLLAYDLIKYHEVAEDINAIATSSDTSGPSALSDASMNFMSHILYVRITEMPSDSSQVLQHMIRWLFRCWNPDERSLTIHQATQFSPLEFLTMLRTCLGLPRRSDFLHIVLPCGYVAQSWQNHLNSQEMIRYLLLLDDLDPMARRPPCKYCPGAIAAYGGKHAIDGIQFRTLHKLAAECFVTKFNNFNAAWKRYMLDRSSPIAIDLFGAMMNTILIALLFLESFEHKTNQNDLGGWSQQALDTADEMIAYATDSNSWNDDDALGYHTTILQNVQPLLPPTQPHLFKQFSFESPQLFQFLSTIGRICSQRSTHPFHILPKNSSGSMDTDDRDYKKASQKVFEGPRKIRTWDVISVDMAYATSHAVTSGQLVLLHVVSKHADTSAMVPSEFYDYVLSMSMENLIYISSAVKDVLLSDFVTEEGDATKLLVRLAELLSSVAFGRSEVVMVICLDVLAAFGSRWTTFDDIEESLSHVASLMYSHYVRVGSEKNAASSEVLQRFVDMLFFLIRTEPDYGIRDGLASPKAILFSIIRTSQITVRFHSGQRLHEIFGHYLLADHDKLFIDILETLPNEIDWLEMMAFRVFVLANLAPKWPNLLRRCIYHIFEIPGKSGISIDHATRCLTGVAEALKLQSSRDILNLFAPQLLFTWVDNEIISDLPYQVFGFTTLQDFTEHVQDELAGQLVMRGGDDGLEQVAEILGISQNTLLERSFAKVVSYAIGQDAKAGKPGTANSSSVLSTIQRKFGQDLYFKLLNQHFVEIVALTFSLIDQESDIERYFKKYKELAPAGERYAKIRRLGSSNAVLPPNQQPMFSGKLFPIQMSLLCSQTVHAHNTLYTPTLLIYMARTLLNASHLALGSLHSCSVLRKLRILVSLAGDSALSGYPLEMLLQSMHPFLVDAECAEDAIGLIKYLLEEGSQYLNKNPSFVAGLGLSYLARVRKFLRSTQSSTTQESQFKSTMSAAQEFREWIGNYLKSYESPTLRTQSRNSFVKLLDSAYAAEYIGNVELGTAESELLFQLLKDEKKNILLDRSTRRAALAMLCSEFQLPSSFRTEYLGQDAYSISFADVVWKSCLEQTISKDYLSWGGRVLGRAFAASGHIHHRLSREFNLRDLEDVDTGDDSSSKVLRLLQDMTLSFDSRTSGLAETALRSILSLPADDVSSNFQDIVSSQIYFASQWTPYQIPPCETYSIPRATSAERELLSAEAISRENWLQDLCIGLAQSSSKNCLLLSLVPILRVEPNFAERIFPFILHLSLSLSSENNNLTNKKISKAFGEWLEQETAHTLQNVRILLNAILYLRTQPMANEKTSADRSKWMDIDYFQAAKAAARCSMPKTALLFVEEASMNQARSSRRSSAIAEASRVPSDLLLAIFENIDDPDMYYGVEQPATLQSILARLEYEKDGTKSLAFRGAQYDSHIRQDSDTARSDLLSLVKSLDGLNQSGLSHALSQSQQMRTMTTESIDSLFHTARKLEQWDLPIPTMGSSNQLTIYKTFQAIHTATDRTKLTMALNEGFQTTMQSLIKGSLSASALHETLQTLASLTEMDEVISSQSSVEFEELIKRFDERSTWMHTGRFDDIAPILSTRGTILSTLSREPELQKITSIPLLDARVVELKAALLSSKIDRAHNALQESLSLAASMIDMIEPCLALDIHVSVAVHIEAATTLWDQGEMVSSIKMLQALDDEKIIKQQTITVPHSNLLSQLGYQVSVARLERADRVVEKYLKPALKELRGKSIGSDAGQVFHQFAVFCDQQLQDPDNLADLDRLRKLKEDKEAEVEEIKELIKSATSASLRHRYNNHLKKAETWLRIDAAELQRQNANQDDFLRQCLENYLLALGASDDHNSNSLRLTALWLEHSEDQNCNEAVAKHLKNVPSRKFAPLMNQLSSRLQDNQSPFQKLLYQLVLRICQDHPYHGMYHVYASRKNKSDAKDEAATSRGKATSRLADELKTSSVASIWQAIYVTNSQYLNLAAERDDKYKQSSKFPLDQSAHAMKLNNFLSRYPVPPPTLSIPLDANCQYDRVPKMRKFDGYFSIAGGVSAPKILTAIADDGKRYKQLVKGGNDDLRQDAIMEQVFEQVSELLKANRSTRQRNLAIRTYKVLPLSSAAGVIEFVADTIPLHEYLMPAHQKYHPNDLKPQQCRKEISDVQQRSAATRIAKFRSVTERFSPAMRYFFTETFPDPDQWFASRLAYTRSTAAISILGHVLGLGDRHGHNILLDNRSGEVVHIDLGVAFEMGRVLPVPELVPFRLTRDIVDGMGITKTEGVFRRCCEFTLEALRKEAYSIMTILDVLRFDPLYSWSMSPVRLAKFQQEQEAASAAPAVEVANQRERPATVNEPGEADRALTVVNKKLSKTLSVTATVNDLINQASDERNLAVLFSGWAAYA